MMWLIAVLACFAILVWQLTKVFTTYFSWPVDSVYREGKGRPTFPDVTICKLYSMDAQLDRGDKWSNYINITNSKKQRCTLGCFRNVTNLTSDDEYDYIWSVLQNPSGYFSSFPPNNSAVQSFSQNLIITSKLFDWDWSLSKVVSNTNHVWDASYGKCYTIQLNDSANGTKVRGLSAILYIDNNPSILANSFFPGTTQSRASGVRVAINTRGLLANMKQGISVGPGTETTIRLRNTERQRVNRPHGNCTDQKLVDNKDNTSVAYTLSGCYELCLQQIYINACNCLNSLFYYSGHQSDSVHGVICGTTDASNASSLDDVQQLACVLSVNASVDACESRCPDPCQENIYDPMVTSAPWPHPSIQLVFYNEYIADRSDIFGDRFNAYVNLSNQSKDDADKIKELRQMTSLQDNFIQLNVIFDRYTPMSLKESPSMTSDNMLSLIGGALSLWLGITVMTAVECVQFVLELIAAMQRKGNTRQEQKKSTVEKDEVSYDASDDRLCRKRPIGLADSHIDLVDSTLTQVSC